MLKRSLILALILGVGGLGIAPDVLCAEVCSTTVQCPCCRRMGISGMHLMPGMHIAKGTKTRPVARCKMACTFFRAPLQTSQHDAAIAVPQSTARAMDAARIGLTRSATLGPPLVQDTSPPPRRSLLCTFLI
jgi:hypothetical protein